jgi:ADP-ribose pyrophosphatase YjhB (NUDIX family)
MWFGGVRVIVKDEKGRVLLVCQRHEGRDIWMLPGGAIEEGENAVEAAKREVLEETGLSISVEELIWHIEEVSPTRGQRFVNYFTASVEGGQCKLGQDPELQRDSQVLKDIRFISRSEIGSMPHLYPPFLKDELWDILDRYEKGKPRIHSVYRNREQYSI